MVGVLEQVDHVKAERNVLAEVHNPYVVKLFYSFQVRSGPEIALEALPQADTGFNSFDWRKCRMMNSCIWSWSILQVEMLW